MDYRQELTKAWFAYNKANDKWKFPDIHAGQDVWDYFNANTVTVTRHTDSVTREEFPRLTFKASRMYLDLTLDPTEFKFIPRT